MRQAQSFAFVVCCCDDLRKLPTRDQEEAVLILGKVYGEGEGSRAAGRTNGQAVSQDNSARAILGGDRCFHGADEAQTESARSDA